MSQKRTLHSEQAPEKPEQTDGAPFRLGRIGTLNQGLNALSKVIRAMADGTIDSQKGARIANALGIHRQYLETMTVEKLSQRLDELEGAPPDHGHEATARQAPHTH
jgi:hypothetical protein